MKKLNYVVMFLFILIGIGGVYGVDIKVSDNDAYTYIHSNTNLTINTYNQTWLDFDGVSDIVNLNMINFTNSSTNDVNSISFWMKSNERSNYKNIMGRIDQMWLRFDASSPQKVTLRVFNSSGTMDNIVWPTAPDDGDWHQYTILNSGTRIKMFFDGIYVTNNNEGDIIGLNESTYNFTVGGMDSYLNGSIDEVTIWKKGLSQIQGTQIYNESSRGGNLGKRVTILMYHCIGSQHSPSCSGPSPTQFDNHLNYLNASGYKTITLKQLEEWMDGTRILEEHTVIITFDDGWMSTIDVAYPILQNYSYVGVVVVPSSYVGLDNRTSYANLTTLINAGWEITSHSVSHSGINFSDISYLDGMLELNNSKSSLEGNLTDYLVTSWVYPYNEHNSTWDLRCGNFYNLCIGDAGNENFHTYKSYDKLGGVVRVVPHNTLSIFVTRVNLEDEMFGLWGFNENQGTIAYDSSGNANNGTIIGADWSNDGNLISTLINSPFLNLNNGFLQYPYSLLWSLFVSDSKPIVDYILLNNTNNVDDYFLEIYNLTNALIYNSNGTVYGSTTINDNDGNINITLNPNNVSYVLDDFKVQEGISRGNSPLGIIRTSKSEIRITNSIEEIVVPVKITFQGVYGSNCENVEKVTYTTDSGVETIYLDNDAINVCKSLTTTGYVLTVETATGSNRLKIDYGFSSFTTSIIQILVGFLSLVLLAVSLVGFYLFVKNNFDTISIKDWITYIVTLIIAVSLYLALINYIVTEVL